MNPFSLKNRSTLFTAVLVILVLFGIYWFFFSSPATPTLPLSITGAATAGKSAQFLILAGELTAVSFDTSIFSDPRFTTLVDISTTVTPEPQGKSDPFAPIAR
ncbi:MAG: hypothetical protein ACREGR_02040 [Minisyncoccia bacterium]